MNEINMKPGKLNGWRPEDKQLVKNLMVRLLTSQVEREAQKRALNGEGFTTESVDKYIRECAPEAFETAKAAVQAVNAYLK